MQKNNNFLLFKKLKDTESAQLWCVTRQGPCVCGKRTPPPPASSDAERSNLHTHLSMPPSMQLLFIAQQMSLSVHHGRKLHTHTHTHTIHIFICCLEQTAWLLVKWVFTVWGSEAHRPVPPPPYQISSEFSKISCHQMGHYIAKLPWTIRIRYPDISFRKRLRNFIFVGHAFWFLLLEYVLVIIVR